MNVKSNLKICIVGLGYIGLPTAALLAKNGYRVHGVDINQNAIDTINKGEIHIKEPELSILVKTAVDSGKLKASTDPEIADIFMIAVPTPFHADLLNVKTNSPIPNVDNIVSAVKKITPFIKSGDLILLESTSPVGTTDMIKDLFKEEGVNIDTIFIAYSPERVLPGKIIKELIKNDRVVGGINIESTKKASKFYRTFVEGEVYETSARTAEMVKLTENSFRDLNIAFANELSILSNDLDIDVRELISLANNHPRVDILDPGCGVGGHCISVDPWFLVDSANGKAKLIEQARRTNEYKAKWTVKKIKDHISNFQTQNNRMPSIACMGLSYKPDIDDLRESPALYIANELNKNFDIKSVEPNIDHCNDLELIDLEDALSMDVCIYLVAHKEFNDVSFKESDLVFYGVRK